jgi:N5-(cytidine 5'-diphosphoramidyl)-L-glutamine hydrolase
LSANPLIAVSQRVCFNERKERFDSLDQRWHEFFAAAGFLPLLIPNNPAIALNLLTRHRVQGILLTGGNNLTSYGGDAPERDQTEKMLLEFGMEKAIPVLGVCRGMQVIQDVFGVPLEKVEGHVAATQEIQIDARRDTVNSYHCYGARISAPSLEVWAKADDGVIKAVRHTQKPVIGMMWHPERLSPFSQRDMTIFREHFQCAA